MCHHSCKLIVIYYSITSRVFYVKLQSVEPVNGAFHKSSGHDGFVVMALYMLYITEISIHGVVEEHILLSAENDLQLQDQPDLICFCTSLFYTTENPKDVPLICLGLVLL